MSWLYSDAWAAGFFDGEGNIYFRRDRRRTPELTAQVTQKLRLPLEILMQQWGGSICATKTPSGCFRWRIATRQAQHFLEAIQPYAVVKRIAIDDALAIRAKVRIYRRRAA